MSAHLCRRRRKTSHRTRPASRPLRQTPDLPLLRTLGPRTSPQPPPTPRPRRRWHPHPHSTAQGISRRKTPTRPLLAARPAPVLAAEPHRRRPPVPRITHPQNLGARPPPHPKIHGSARHPPRLLAATGLTLAQRPPCRRQNQRILGKCLGLPRRPHRPR